MTYANDIYNLIDLDGDIPNQVKSFCSNNSHLVESFEGKNVIFTDASALSFDEYSVATGGN